MPLFTKIQSHRKLLQLWTETFINTQTKVTKVSQNSVLGGIAAANAKLAQKTMTEIALVESHLYPDNAFGDSLDTIAENRGISPRQGALSSFTHVRLNGSSGTIYPLATTFTGSHGFTFELQKAVTIGDHLYTYGPVVCTDTGVETNVDPGTISEIIGTPPAGHTSVTNEYMGTGGRDEETDSELRARIKDGSNICAVSTIAYITSVFQSINDNILRVTFGGHTNTGKAILYVQTVNSADLSSPEIDTLLQDSEEFFALSELRSFDTTDYGIEIQNVQYSNIDISMRVALNAGANSDAVRISIQTQMAKIIDPRTWNPLTQIVEWDNLLVVAKGISGIDYLADQHFLLNGARGDSQITRYTIPRIRNFQLLDLDGAILSSVSGTIAPSFYPNDPDSATALTALATV